eukprot:3009421-Prymnesium_polylepis.1
MRPTDTPLARPRPHTVRCAIPTLGGAAVAPGFSNGGTAAGRQEFPEHLPGPSPRVRSVGVRTPTGHADNV